MAPETQESRRRGAWRTAGRVVVSLVIVGAVLLWVLTSLFLWGFRCDENCSGDDYDKWQWTGQLVLAAAGAALAATGLVLGFTSRVRAYRGLMAVSAGCALVWLLWILGGGF